MGPRAQPRVGGLPTPGSCPHRDRCPAGGRVPPSNRPRRLFVIASRRITLRRHAACAFSGEGVRRAGAGTVPQRRSCTRRAAGSWRSSKCPSGANPRIFLERSSCCGASSPATSAGNSWTLRLCRPGGTSAWAPKRSRTSAVRGCGAAGPVRAWCPRSLSPESETASSTRTIPAWRPADGSPPAPFTAEKSREFPQCARPVGNAEVLPNEAEDCALRPPLWSWGLARLPTPRPCAPPTGRRARSPPVPRTRTTAFRCGSRTRRG